MKFKKNLLQIELNQQFLLTKECNKCEKLSTKVKISGTIFDIFAHLGRKNKEIHRPIYPLEDVSKKRWIISKASRK